MGSNAFQLHLATVPNLDEILRDGARRALQASHGRIEGPFGAAKALGINPYTLRGRMRKLKINWRQFRG